MSEPALLNPQLKRMIKNIQDTSLRKKTIALLEDPSFEINGKKHTGIAISESPAGKSHHHCYPGGYIEHVVSTLNIANAMCDCIERVYQGRVNRDITTVGVLLHDLFKPVTYAQNKNGSYSSTSLGEYLDHLSMATSELVRRGFPIEVIHVVTAHHGEYGPIRPRTIEALVCHLADFADSRLNGEVMNAAAYLTRRTCGLELPAMNSKEAFEIVHSKAVEGWAGVSKTVKKLTRNRRNKKTL